VCRYNCEIP